MWEINVFKRLVPAFAVLIMAVVLYITCKYVIAGMFAAFNASGQDPSTWGLAYWLFGLMGVIIVWFYCVRAFLIIKGRISTGMEEPRKPGRKPKSEGYPPETPPY